MGAGNGFLTGFAIGPSIEGSLRGETMGDENTILGVTAARHLLRRTGFGASPKDVASYAGLTRGQAADRLLSFKPKGFKPAGRYIDLAHNNWLKYILKAPSGLSEKLVLFWHDHFATGYSKVLDIKRMGVQNRLLRQNCKGNFKTLVKNINKDPAMMEYLDTVRNFKLEVPNENYARELKELFTLGVKDVHGNENYTQEDIVQVARAFTGWTYDGRRNVAYFDGNEHDTNAEFLAVRGTKEIFGPSHGGFATPQRFDQPEGETEIDQVIDIIFAHRDSDGENTVARRTARRLLEFFTHGGFSEPGPAEIDVIDDVVATSGFAVNFELQPLLRAIFVHDEFYASLSDATKKSVKWPVDFAVGTLRTLGVRMVGRYAYVPGGAYRGMYEQMGSMGQLLLDPPSVFGWDWESAWVSSSTLLARYSFARDIGAARGNGGLKVAKLVDVGLTDPGDVVDAVAAVLGIDPLPSADRDILVDYLGGPGAVLDLDDYATRYGKLHGLFTLMIQSPAYQLH